MARTKAKLGEGERLTDHVSLGVLAKYFPRGKILEILKETKTASERQRLLPAHVVMYYVIALSLYLPVSMTEVLRCLVEGLKWLWGEEAVTVAGKSGISQARTRLGVEPVKRLHDAVVAPVGTRRTKGTFYRRWRLVSLDGSTLDVSDTRANAMAFGRAGASRGETAYPQLRFVSLLECGTHVLFGTAMGGYKTGEITLAKEVIPSLGPGMLCLADREFFGYALWNEARGTGAELLWRIKKNLVLPVEQRLADGSYVSRVYPSAKDRRHGTKGVALRVIEYRLPEVPDAEPLYRLVTTIFDPEAAPAAELAAVYHERWEIETALDELKTHLRGARIVLRSKTPELVKQEFYGLMMAHFAVRALMHEAAVKGDADPDELSFVHAVRVIKRKLPRFVAVPPSALEAPA